MSSDAAGSIGYGAYLKGYWFAGFRGLLLSSSSLLLIRSFSQLSLPLMYGATCGARGMFCSAPTRKR